MSRCPNPIRTRDLAANPPAVGPTPALASLAERGWRLLPPNHYSISAPQIHSPLYHCPGPQSSTVRPTLSAPARYPSWHRPGVVASAGVGALDLARPNRPTSDRRRPDRSQPISWPRCGRMLVFRHTTLVSSVLELPSSRAPTCHAVSDFRRLPTSSHDDPLNLHDQPASCRLPPRHAHHKGCYISADALPADSVLFRFGLPDRIASPDLLLVSLSVVSSPFVIFLSYFLLSSGTVTVSYHSFSRLTCPILLCYYHVLPRTRVQVRASRRGSREGKERDAKGLAAAIDTDNR
jgi:hypothetical protein